ncbi:uncharacterized protein [Argopecten irradians]|uniref:uncharacterized protein n=1 Tax=Argopecten irradians TaxID=31199 RepID=UPI00372465B0
MEKIWRIIIVLFFLLIDNVACASYRRGRYYSYRSYTYYSGGGSTDSSVGIIVGAVIGGLCLVGGIIFVICLIKFCNKKKGTVVANQPHGTENITMVSSDQ